MLLCERLKLYNGKKAEIISLIKVHHMKIIECYLRAFAIRQWRIWISIHSHQKQQRIFFLNLPFSLNTYCIWQNISTHSHFNFNISFHYFQAHMRLRGNIYIISTWSFMFRDEVWKSFRWFHCEFLRLYFCILSGDNNKFFLYLVRYLIKVNNS